VKGPTNIELTSHVKRLSAMQAVVEQHDDQQDLELIG
jgi:hypothetical protein